MAGVPVIVGGIALLVSAVWCRRGRSPAARWWVGMNDDRPAYLTREPLALLVIPYLGQLAVVIGVALLPGVGDSAAVPVLLLSQLVALGVCAGAGAYRTFLPMWVYPAWLRPQRRREREEFRQRAR